MSCYLLISGTTLFLQLIKKKIMWVEMNIHVAHTGGGIRNAYRVLLRAFTSNWSRRRSKLTWKVVIKMDMTAWDWIACGPFLSMIINTWISQKQGISCSIQDLSATNPFFYPKGNMYTSGLTSIIHVRRTNLWLYNTKCIQTYKLL